MRGKHMARHHLLQSSRKNFVSEPLEGRILLSTLLVNGTSGDDVITLDVTSDGGIKTVVNGTETVYAPGKWTDVVVASGSGTDTINVKATVVPTTVRYADIANIQVGDAHGVQDINAALTANGALPGPARGGLANLTIDDTGDTAARSVVLNATDGPVETITGIAPAEIDLSRVNPFAGATPPQTSTDSLAVITGSGNDSVGVRGLLPDLPTTIRNSGGVDILNIGDGSLAAISSAIQVGAYAPLSAAGPVVLNVDDSADTSAATFTLDAIFPPGPGAYGFVYYQLSSSPVQQTIQYHASDVKSLTVQGGGGQTTFDVKQTVVPTTLIAGPTFGGLVASFGADTSGAIDTLVVSGRTALVGAALPTQLIDVTAGKIAGGNITITYPSYVQLLDLQTGDFAVNGDLGPIHLTAGVRALPATTHVIFNASQNLAALDIVNATAALAPAGDRVINTDALDIASATLDLTNNALQVHYGAADPLGMVRQWIFGHQINTSSADDRHNLGYADSADGVVNGLSSSTVLVKYALYGDANLDGQVGFDDLVLLARNYGKDNADWDQGDFNYDGHVGFDDLVRLARNYGRPAPSAAAARR